MSTVLEKLSGELKMSSRRAKYMIDLLDDLECCTIPGTVDVLADAGLYKVGVGVPIAEELNVMFIKRACQLLRKSVELEDF